MKIICIGRNYVEHARELKNEIPEEPVVFLKPDSALLMKNQDFYYPSISNDIHYEVELILKINRLGKNIEEKFAHKYYDEIGIGIDFTARDLQAKYKSKGLPWTLAKGFDCSAPVGTKFAPKKSFKDVNEINFSLKKNGEIVQNGQTSNMIFTFDKLISYISQFMTLKLGDLIFTGTPKGVGPVQIGDCLEAYIEDKKMLVCNVK